MVIVDTSAWIDLLDGAQNPETAWLEREIRRQPVGLTDLILCEVLQGVRDNAVSRQVRSSLLKFEIFDCGGLTVALAAAENYRSLRGRGITVRKTIDCLIATFCIEEGHSLLHRDRDFEPFERHLGLQVVHA